MWALASTTRKACQLAQLPPVLTHTPTYPADGGGRRLRTTTSSSPAPSPREGQHGAATMASSVVAADAVTLC